jgi:prevent-host-death family protein
MAFVGIRELSREISKTLGRLEQDGEPVIITNHGRPVAALVAVDQHNLEDLVLAATPEAARRRRAADDAIAAGQGVRLADVSVEAGEADSSVGAQSQSHEALVAQLKPAHARLLGWEPSDQVLGRAAGSLSEIVLSVVNTISPTDADAPEVARRVEELNTEIYTRLWAHSLRDAVEVQLEEMTREPGVAGGGLANERVVEATVTNAADQLRAINARLVGSASLSMDAYEATVAALVDFDEMAHHDHAPHEVTAEPIS